MSERVQNGSTGKGPGGSKSERRLAAQLAAKKAAEAKRRRQSILGALAGVAVIGVLIGVFVVVGNAKDDKNQAAATPSASVDPVADASDPLAGQLPEGADPALATRPEVGPGKGELKKLTVTTLIEGKGAKVQAGQQITTNYVGVFYKDGKEFDASWNHGQPVTFGIGVGQVIPGWDQGLVGVTVGSRVQLDIPGELAYGNDASSGRPAGPLRFVVDILATQ